MRPVANTLRGLGLALAAIVGVLAATPASASCPRMAESAECAVRCDCCVSAEAPSRERVETPAASQASVSPDRIESRQVVRTTASDRCGCCVEAPTSPANRSTKTDPSPRPSSRLNPPEPPPIVTMVGGPLRSVRVHPPNESPPRSPLYLRLERLLI